MTTAAPHIAERPRTSRPPRTEAERLRRRVVGDNFVDPADVARWRAENLADQRAGIPINHAAQDEQRNPRRTYRHDHRH